MTITGPFSFTAHWKRSATVDLQLEGGLWTSETPVTSYTVTKNTSPLEDVEHITLPGLADVTRDGWRFDGWALTPGGTVLYAPGATITAPDVNMTLHARWTGASLHRCLRDRRRHLHPHAHRRDLGFH